MIDDLVAALEGAGASRVGTFGPEGLGAVPSRFRPVAEVPA